MVLLIPILVLVFLQIVVEGTSGERYTHQSLSNGQKDVRKIVVDRPMERGREVNVTEMACEECKVALQ